MGQSAFCEKGVASKKMPLTAAAQEESDTEQAEESSRGLWDLLAELEAVQGEELPVHTLTGVIDRGEAQHNVIGAIGSKGEVLC